MSDINNCADDLIAYLLAEFRCAARRAKFAADDMVAISFALKGSLVTPYQAIMLIEETDAFRFLDRLTGDKRTAKHIIDVVRQVEALTGEQVVLIVIDTLSRAFCGGDENSSKDMGAIVTTTGLLQQGTGAHIMWIHHIPVDGGERMRGHGALLGAMDTTISVVKADAGRTATVIKANDSEEGERVAFTLESVPIGQDSDGNQTTAPVVVPLESLPARTASSGRLTKAAHIALRALVEALDEHGQPAPTSNHIPAGVKVIDVSTWRQQAYRRGISTSDEERAKQQAFKRASEHLIGAGRVGIWDRSVWIT